jgi:hypothetical protein
MILCITDAFTKNAEVIAISDKHAEEKSQEKYTSISMTRKQSPVHSQLDSKCGTPNRTDFLNVNKKLAPKWIGQATIIQVNESVAKIKLQNNRTKTLNVKRLKLFIPKDDTQDEQDTKNEETMSKTAIQI